MSLLFILNNDLVNMKGYMLSESILPIKTNKYGTNKDMTNQQWKEWDGNKITFTKINDIYYMIGINKRGEAMFTISSTLDFDRISDFNYLNDKFTTDRTQTKGILRVFGTIIYILIQGALQYNHNRIIFNGEDKALGSAYGHMVSNKYLLDSIRDYGFIYDGFDGEYYNFVKGRV